MSNYVVIDLEMCNVFGEAKKAYGYRNEIIEIGAVLLNESYEIKDSFKTYVLPQYGSLTSHIKKLTGITNRHLKGAPDITRAVDMLMNWVPEDSVMVTWSSNDAFQLEKEFECKGIEKEKLKNFISDNIDCQIMFSNKINSLRDYSLEKALVIAGIDYLDGAHDALVDAKNTALLFKKLMVNTDKAFSSLYDFGEEKKSTYNPFADLLASFSTAV